MPGAGKINRSEMRQALLRSGYLLESRIESYLRDRHWGYVEANPTYEDPETGKSREYDVFAMYGLPAGPNERDWLFGVLLVECVNNPQPLVVITKEPQTSFLHYLEVRVAGLPVKIPAPRTAKGWRGIAEYLHMERFHHYCRDRVGTQFCSFAKKKTGNTEEWFALHEGSQFDSFKKLCDVTEYRIDRHFKSWILVNKEFVNIEMYYPVIVVQGELLDARLSKRSITLRSSDHIQFRRSVSRGERETDYQIDVIRERFLPRFMDMIDQELKKTATSLKYRSKIVRKSIDQIVEEAAKKDADASIRTVFDL
jgi:hypothetical protein